MNQKITSKQHLEGATIIGFSVDHALWLQIQKNKYFNFEENNFVKVPPSHFKSGSLFLIASQDHAKEMMPGENASIDPNQWNIFRMELDEIIYETFISLRVTGQLPGSIQEAVLDFSIKKSTEGQDLSEESKTTIKELFADFFSLEQSGNANEFNSKNLIISSIANLFGSKEESDLTQLVEGYLKLENIPAVKENSTYSFHVKEASEEWEVVLEIDEKKIIVFSYASFKSQLDLDSTLSEDLEVINQEITTGQFGIAKEQNILYLKSELVINPHSKPNEMETMITPILNTMNAVLLLFKEKYKESISFS
jgi:hypothetical protein